ncbi:MAG: dicarboxylate/amino acid:cation symporter [Synergistaceae bacterium]|nr:dicarboxylate/amino acid:cation symporter [Synergistaceae bacterium]
MKKKFKPDEIGKALEYISSCLESMKLGGKDIKRAELMYEEALMSLTKHSDGGAFTVRLRKIFGDVSIEISVSGNEFDFWGNQKINSEPDEDEYDEEFLRAMILRSFENLMSYRHSWNRNTVRIQAVRSNYSGLYRVLTALCLAVLSGLLLRNFAPESVSMSVNEHIFVPIRTIFLNGLRMCAVPVVFLSIVSSVSGMSGISEVKRLGRNFLKPAVMFKILELVSAFCLVYLLRPGAGVEAVMASSKAVEAETLSFSRLLTEFFAGNIIRPFLEGNMLQIMVIALLMGLVMLMTDSENVQKFFAELNTIFMKVTGIFLYLVPLVIFSSTASMIITTGLETVVSAAGIMGTIFLETFLLFVMLCVSVKIFAKLSPLILLRKSVPMLTTAFSTCSSIATVPENMKCAEELGVPSSVYSFSIPVGVSMNKIYSFSYFIIIVFSAANMYGIEMTLSTAVSTVLTSLILSVVTPSLPGAGLITMSAALSQAGCPLDFLGIGASIEMIVDFAATLLISFGNLVCTVFAANSENLIDREKYNS